MFSTYQLLNEETVLSYVKEKLPELATASHVSVKEIGDGNLNYVYRIKDEGTGQSIILKQAGDTARISDEFKLSPDRNRIETEALTLQGSFVSDLVPTIYFFDEVMNCCAMEDLGEFQIMRQALVEHKMFPQFADHITTFMTETLVRTSDVVMPHKDKKEQLKRFVNPELCEISEDLVFTEPYYNNFNRNEVTPGNEAFVEEHLYQNTELHRHVAKLKYTFLTKSESLIHGDMHTGSIFIKEGETKVIDPEFAFYGPMGYDVGNVVANLIFAWANGVVSQDDSFVDWIEKTLVEVVDQFKEKFVATWKNHAIEPFAVQNEAFVTTYLEDVLKDTAGMAGLEMNRRIVGLAKVKDITILEGEARLRAERLVMTLANQFILNASAYQTGDTYLKALHEVKEHQL
ncbi:S-methyl-5-thioribose kinase [Chryseomicrobium excrementi]|uniref:S-methyl-5-thioribose kinase n=1 Tax=Chryseomicrobium excrementi TaxID=2041346 RepID=A0A2M9F0I2_9BACL|nr:S-methyl-5-thioribose kinase [Chryseomicrobium excrementi]PJK16969.1 S-methyl-5-thioribose kinase [Chryseomicrobium excrementi]